MCIRDSISFCILITSKSSKIFINLSRYAFTAFHTYDTKLADYRCFVTYKVVCHCNSPSCLLYTSIEGAIGAANPEFTYGYVKAASITVNAETAVKTDGAVMKLTFKSLTGEKGSFQLSNGYNTKLGYNTSLLVDSDVYKRQPARYERGF